MAGQNKTEYTGYLTHRSTALPGVDDILKVRALHKQRNYTSLMDGAIGARSEI